jgi:aldose 1-epimerase
MIHDEGRVGVVFEYRSRDGEEGYPGNLKVKVKYTLNGTRLSIRYSALTDKRTPVNLCNHSYFNLTGFDNPLVTGHFLQINALEYTGKGETNTPTGDILKLSGTPLDFSRPKKIAEDMDKFPADGGFDHNYVLSRQRSGEIVPAAELYDPETGRILRVFTDQPGIQLYTANWWDGSPSGRQHRSYIKHGGVALETQAFPDSPNHPNFPDTILNVGELYQSTTIYEFDNK